MFAPVAASAHAARAFGFDPNAYCCLDIGLRATGFVPGKSISVSWTLADANVSPGELHAGYNLVNGVIVTSDPGYWDGNIQSNGIVKGAGSATFQAGADNTIGSLSFTRDFYVQIWYRCYYLLPTYDPKAPPPPAYCSHIGPLDDLGRAITVPQFYSVAVKVPVAGATTATTAATTATQGAASTTGVAKRKAVAFSTATTVEHRDGTTSRATSTMLVDGDTVASLGNPVKLSWKDGRIAIDRHSELLFGPVMDDVPVQERVDWSLFHGSAWVAGNVGIDTFYATVRVADGSEASIATEQKPRGIGSNAVVRCIAGTATVQPDKKGAPAVVLHAGEQTTVVNHRAATKPVRSTSPPRIFWR